MWWERIQRWFSSSATAVGILQFVLPSVTFSALMGWIFHVWSNAIAWVQAPAVYVPWLVFAYCLWMCIAMAVILGFKKARKVKIVHDYAYSLIVEGGWQATLGRLPPNHPTNPNADAIILSMGFRNTGSGPLKTTSRRISGDAERSNPR